MSLDLRFPNITATTPEGQLNQMRSFLHQTIQQLNWAFKTIESGAGSSPAVTARSTSGGSSGEEKNPTNTFNDIKYLIKIHLRHIGFIIKRTAITNKKNFILWHSECALRENSLLFKLKLHLANLIFNVCSAGPRCNTTRNKLCCGFGHEKHRVSKL